MSEQEAAGFDRRAFVRRMAIGGFAIPAIASFKLDSLARAGGYSHQHPNQTHPNQTYPNQTYGNQTFPNEPCQSFPNQSYGNQSFPPIFKLPFPHR